MLGAWQRYAVNSNPPYAITANAAYRRSVFEEIGPFDPRMPRAQDVELGLRFSERSDLRLVYSAEAVVRHRHRSTQRGFFRQQLGWSYGAGLVAAKYHALDGRPSPPPRLSDVGTRSRASGASSRLRVPARRPRSPYRREFLEDAWFGLMRQVAWYIGARAGLWRGARIFARRGRSEPSAAARPTRSRPKPVTTTSATRAIPPPAGLVGPQEHDLRHQAVGRGPQQEPHRLGDVLGPDHLLGADLVLHELGHRRVDEPRRQRRHLDPRARRPPSGSTG